MGVSLNEGIPKIGLLWDSLEHVASHTNAYCEPSTTGPRLLPAATACKRLRWRTTRSRPDPLLEREPICYAVGKKDTCLLLGPLFERSQKQPAILGGSRANPTPQERCGCVFLEGFALVSRDPKGNPPFWNTFHLRQTQGQPTRPNFWPPVTPTKRTETAPWTLSGPALSQLAPWSPERVQMPCDGRRLRWGSNRICMQLFSRFALFDALVRWRPQTGYLCVCLWSRNAFWGWL